ncbi:hypothetical protein [Rhodanobacter sp. DHB23]|uniref:hypothetical protein n=1 Tax=Rhodanobacter sp. DHB23 TaxID=2775923 RepID=UPI00177EE633|nr:hypothetical protein [Rhodanobacter sp. DHB23]MBD8874196.1 hypothetical protein [Rhodanobacter sp. DHB23]
MSASKKQHCGECGSGCGFRYAPLQLRHGPGHGDVQVEIAAALLSRFEVVIFTGEFLIS